MILVQRRNNDKNQPMDCTMAVPLRGHRTTTMQTRLQAECIPMQRSHHHLAMTKETLRSFSIL